MGSYFIHVDTCSVQSVRYRESKIEHTLITLEDESDRIVFETIVWYRAIVVLRIVQIRGVSQWFVTRSRWELTFTDSHRISAIWMSNGFQWSAIGWGRPIARRRRRYVDSTSRTDDHWYWMRQRWFEKKVTWRKILAGPSLSFSWSADLLRGNCKTDASEWLGKVEYDEWSVMRISLLVSPWSLKRWSVLELSHDSIAESTDGV